MAIEVNNVIPVGAIGYSATFGRAPSVFRIFPFPTTITVTNTIEIPAPPRVRVTQYQHVVGNGVEEFGSDTPVFPDMDASAALYGGREILADHLLRRLLTPKGSIPMLPDYGIDIRDFLSEKISEDSLFAMKAVIENELLEDERVEAASVVLTYDSPTETMTADISVQVSSGPFQFTVKVNELDVQLMLGENNASNI